MIRFERPTASGAHARSSSHSAAVVASSSSAGAILLANLFVQVAELIVNAIEIATGELPSAAAGGLLIHLVLGTLFGWALYKSRRVSLAPL